MIAPEFILMLASCLPPDAGHDASDIYHATARAQESQTVARFQMAGETKTVLRDEVSLFLMQRTRNSRTTKEAVQHLIDVALVKQAAVQASMMPSTEDVDAEMRRIEARLKQSKQDFDKILAQSRLTREAMSEQLALSIAKRRLTAKALRKPLDQVTDKHLELWSRQRRNKATIITDASQLPSGVSAKVGESEILDLDVGRILFIKITPDNLARTVQEIVFTRLIAHESNAQGIRLSKQQFEQQFAKTKAKFERNARSQGVKYEEWLTAMGGSKQKELDSPTMRSILQHEQLVRRRYSTTLLDDMLAKDGAALHRRHGARRNLSILFLRATQNPNKIVKITFIEAAEQARLLRESITQGKRSFAMVARTSSDDPDSKAAGGQIGWQHQRYLPGARNQRAPAQVLEAAFSLPIGKVSEPVKTDDGYYLVYVSGIEPTPDKPTVQRRMLGELSERYSQELIRDAKIAMLIE